MKEILRKKTVSIIALPFFIALFLFIAEQLFTATTLNANIATDGSVSASGTLDISGSSTLYSTLQLGGYASDNLNYNIVAQANGNAASRTDVITTDNDFFIEGNLETDGLSYLDSGFISSASSTVSGNFFVAGNLTVSSTASISGRVQQVVQSVVGTDNGAGSAQSITLTPTSGYVEINCQDSSGCNVTLSETDALQGTVVTIMNISANTITFSDSSGVLELNNNGSLSLTARYNTLVVVYASDRWVELSRVSFVDP
jgi:hypothetical protein